MVPTAALSKVLDVVIIGGGLSGLLVAHETQRKLPSASWVLLEGRAELGGRLANDKMGHRIDLGGAWVWPDFQPKISRLIEDLKIQTFLQPGDSSSTRFDGGAVEMIHALSKTLPKESLRLAEPVTSLSLIDESKLEGTCSVSGDANKKVIRVDTGAGPVYAKSVVVAVPPRIASKHIQFDPPLSPAKQKAMKSSHTWMAAVTKVSLVYSEKFWNDNISNMGFPRNVPGPAFQMYDASTKDGSIHALTFFSLVPPDSPAKTSDQVLADQVSSQVGTVWRYMTGTDLTKSVKNYSHVHVQHWPHEKLICEDLMPTQVHPHPMPVAALSTSEWGGQLFFAGTESDRESPGVMEGAVGAAQRAFSEVEALLKKT